MKKLKQQIMFNKEKGQILIVLLMIMIAGLVVGLFIVQRSLTGLTTSNQGEQSTRAFAAAEAGIERAIKTGPTGAVVQTTNLGNQSTVNVTKSAILPTPGQALEYPPIDKGTIAHFWLADPTTYATVYPANANLNIYFGCTVASEECKKNAGGTYNPNSDPPALEVSLITWDPAAPPSGQYRQESPIVIDTAPNPITRIAGTAAKPVYPCDSSDPNGTGVNTIITSNSRESTGVADRTFRCKYQLRLGNIAPNRTPIILRARLLISEDKHPVAVQPVGAGVFLPQQAVIYTAIGNSGQAQKTLQHFRLMNVVPPYFNYAIFSIGSIDK